MISNRNIGRILRIIEQNTKKWSQPSVSMLSSEYSSPYRILVATVLSLRTKDNITMAASKRLFQIADTPESICSLTQKQIIKLIYPVAFYRNKASHILNFSSELIEKYGGSVPQDMDELLKFKGVGRKTANLVQILGFGIPAICVDTHVHRISNRFGYIKSKSPDESERLLRAQLPKKHWLKFNDLLVTFGQNQCKPISPVCTTCAINIQCPKINVTHHR